MPLYGTELLCQFCHDVAPKDNKQNHASRPRRYRNWTGVRGGLDPGKLKLNADSIHKSSRTNDDDLKGVVGGG